MSAPRPGTFDEADIAFMQRALQLAKDAELADEVPVGAVLVHNGELLAEGRNQPIVTNDPTAHAEIIAIRTACRKANNYRLTGSTLYVTLEPCLMCVGALITARVRRLVFAARDLRFGAVRSKFQTADSALLNHTMQVEEGLMAANAAQMLKTFFERLRDP